MTMTSQAVISLEGITKIFRTTEIETHALSEISLTINAGDFVAIMGPSGCGKSTLLGLIGLLDSPTDGKYFLKGEDVSRLSRARRATIRNHEIGYVFQNFNLISDLTVKENVELPLTYRRLSPKERCERVLTILERVHMSSRINHYPAQLSGGQQQRVAVARAIVGDPAVLLADEPTGNLDSNAGKMVMDLLVEANGGGTTVCMVTHSVSYSAFAGRVIQLFDGNLVA